MVTFAKSENAENDGFPDFSQINRKSYESKVKQNNSTELVGFSFLLKTYYSNGPPDPPPDFKTDLFPDLLQEM